LTILLKPAPTTQKDRDIRSQQRQVAQGTRVRNGVKAVLDRNHFLGFLVFAA
jgi:hypothetical protein